MDHEDQKISNQLTAIYPTKCTIRGAAYKYRLLTMQCSQCSSLSIKTTVITRLYLKMVDFSLTLVLGFVYNSRDKMAAP